MHGSLTENINELIIKEKSEMKTYSGKNLLGLGIIAAIASSLCCVTPVLALIAGTSGIATTFSWLQPARPYLIGLSALVLGLAWYGKLRPIRADECDCVEVKKPKFINSKKFLLIVTIFSALMIAFPYYSVAFFNDPPDMKTSSTIQKVEFSISGMYCPACAKLVEHEVQKLNGVTKVEASYQKGNAIVEFDGSKVTIQQIEDAINKTGYKVTGKKNL